jgi:hypothetical protein
MLKEKKLEGTLLRLLDGEQKMTSIIGKISLFEIYSELIFKLKNIKAMR